MAPSDYPSLVAKAFCKEQKPIASHWLDKVVDFDGLLTPYRYVRRLVT